MDTVNNERFKMLKLRKNTTIQHENKIIKFDAVKDDAVQRCFRICYATSIHSSQG